MLGELPPPPPRVCFGRDELIKKIVGLAENLTPIALIGAGGIGKSSVSLAVLHHDRIKKMFGDNRRFIRCDRFSASCAHFLARLSQVVGAGIKNPKDLAPLRPSLSAEKTLIVLDNAESILDPRGAKGREIYGVVDELSRFKNICLVITSRITTTPPNCKTLNVPTLSEAAAYSTFDHISKNGRRSTQINNILKQLDFHPLSVTLLATVAHQNRWDNDRLAKEWKQRRTGVLRPEHETSLAITIELSLSSPLFKTLGPNARGLLGVVAFYPQGVNEKNLSWLLPKITNAAQIFDKLCVLSLTYRSNGFITMLAPLRDHFCPKDPKSSPLLCTTKEQYFDRMSVELDPSRPGFEDARWITSEDVNVEHLLDAPISADSDSDDTWRACINFMRHLNWYKPRQTILGPKIEALPDSHSLKPKCLYELAMLAETIGNDSETIRLLNHALKLERQRKNDRRVASTLMMLSHTSQMLGLYKEGIRQAEEALGIYEQLGKAAGRAECSCQLARLLHSDGQYDAAEKAALQSIKLLPKKGQEYKACLSHRTLGNIYRSKNQRKKAIHHYELALGIASSSNWRDHLLWTHFSLAELFLAEDKFEDAYSHSTKAKAHAHDNPYDLARVVTLQARILYPQGKLKDAKSEVLRALEIFKKVGASKDQQACKTLLQKIERASKSKGVPPPAGQIPMVSF